MTIESLSLTVMRLKVELVTTSALFLRRPIQLQQTSDPSSTSPSLDLLSACVSQIKSTAARPTLSRLFSSATERWTRNASSTNVPTTRSSSRRNLPSFSWSFAMSTSRVLEVLGKFNVTLTYDDDVSELLFLSLSVDTISAPTSGATTTKCGARASTRPSE